MAQNLHVGLMTYTLRSLIQCWNAQTFGISKKQKRKLYDFLYKRRRREFVKKERKTEMQYEFLFGTVKKEVTTNILQ